MSSPFIRTARTKGLPLSTIVLCHAIKPTLLPGLGRLLVGPAVNRDYTLVLGLVVLVTTVAVLLNLLIDLCYAWLDPKIRY